MLPRSRIASVLILGLGAALIVIGVLLPQLIESKPKLPLNLPPISYTMYAKDGVSTKVNDDGNREEVHSALRRQFHGQLVQPADSDRVSVRVGVTAMRELPAEVVGTDSLTELIDASVWTFTIDRLTGEFLAPATIVDRMAGVPREWPVEGHWVKLPTNTERKDYAMFDDFLRESVPAKFVDTVDHNGTELLHFRQRVDKTNVAQKFRSYVSQITHDGKTGFLQYEGTRDWWVEPKSGVVVDAAEDVHLWWETREGEPIMDYLRFNGQMNEQDSAKLLGGALTYFKGRTLQPWSAALITIGAILTFLGMFGAVRPDSMRSRLDETPRHENSADTDDAGNEVESGVSPMREDAVSQTSEMAAVGDSGVGKQEGDESDERRRSSESKAYYELENIEESGADESAADGRDTGTRK